MRVNPIATASMEDKSICACSSKQGRWQFRRYMPTIMDIDDDKWQRTVKNLDENQDKKPTETHVTCWLSFKLVE